MRPCDWQARHPADTEDAARYIAADARYQGRRVGVLPHTPPGAALREACGRLHPAGCPTILMPSSQGRNITNEARYPG